MTSCNSVFSEDMQPAVQSRSNEAGLADIPVRHERGQRAVFCGLTSIIWLHRKIQDAFFLVVGSRTCAHLIQSAAGVMIFAEPRFATAVLQDKDLAGIADCNDEIDRIVAQVLERRPNIKTFFLVSSCPSEVIKLDLANSVQRLARNYAGKVRFAEYSGSGIESTFTQGEDNCLKGLVPELPSTNTDEKNLLVVGTLADVVEDQFARLFTQLGITSYSFFPSRQLSEMPAVGANTRILLAQPYLGETVRALLARGAQLIAAPFPLGAEGTLEWLRAAATEWGVADSHFAGVTEVPYARAKRAIHHYENKLQDKRVSLLPDSQLEIPLARFLYRECGVQLLEIGVPFYDQQVLSAEMKYLPANAVITEGQSLDDQLDRVRHDKPDLTVCGLGIANPLEAEELRTKWSIEFMFTPIQGFDQAGDLAELFARPLNRQARLKV